MMYRLLFVVALFGSACPAQTRDTIIDLHAQFKDFQGAFVLFDQQKQLYSRHNPAQCAERFSPASTFKIPNSLIGLETGVIRDQHFSIPWDSVRRSVPDWNRDHDLESAIRVSAVWYFQELARRVGYGRMRRWIDTLGYGNCDISGGIDRFWLGSSLLISANEQVEFLRRLQGDDLPFSRRSIQIVKEILVLEKTKSTVLRGKTGFSANNKGLVAGWFVGTIERSGNIYIFASNIIGREGDADRVFQSRKEIAVSILRDLHLLEEPP
jgi:beta-lactamase class D